MKKYLLVMLLGSQFATQKAHSQNIAINGTGSLPDTSAMLDVSSASKGFLAPRMTTTQQNAIPLPAKGLLVYNTTDNTFKVNTGTTSAPVWTTLSYAGSSTGITSINGINNVSQTFAVGTSGNDVSIASSGSVHTFNFPTASTSARGLMSTADQSFAGNKTFSGNVITNGYFSAINLAAGASTDNVVTVDASGVFKKRPMSAFTSSGSTTNLLTNNGTNDITSTVNGQSSTTKTVYSVSNTSNNNVISTTVNGITGNNVNLINSHTMSSSGNTIYSSVNGVNASANAVNTVTLNSSNNNVYVSVNNVQSNTGQLVYSNILQSSNNTITSNVNGISANTTAVNTVSNTSSGNTMTTTVNGVTGSGGQIINTNVLSNNGTNDITSTINGVQSTTKTVYSVSNTSANNVLSTTVNGITGANVKLINSSTLSSSGNVMTSSINGINATANMVNTVSNTSSNNTLTTSVNNVNAGGVNIINSNVLSISGSTLTSNINGVSSSVNLPSSSSSTGWMLKGNNNSNPPGAPSNYGSSTFGSNDDFIGTSNAKDVVFGVNNMERMRIMQNGWVGIGTANPSKPLELISKMPNVGLVKLQNTDASGYSSIDVWSNTTMIGNIGFANTGGSYPNAFYFATNTTNSMVFATNNAERFRIDGNTGFVGFATQSPSSTVEVEGSFSTAIASVSNNNYTLSNTNHTLVVTTGNSDRTITLPSPSGIDGRIYVVKKVDSGNGSVILDAVSSTIDGARTLSLSKVWKFASVQSTGSSWVVIASN